MSRYRHPGDSAPVSPWLHRRKDRRGGVAKKAPVDDHDSVAAPWLMLEISSPSLRVVRPLRRRRRARGGSSGYGLRSFYPRCGRLSTLPAAPFYIGKHRACGALRPENGQKATVQCTMAEVSPRFRLRPHEREGRRHNSTGPNCVKRAPEAARREKDYGQETAATHPCIRGNHAPAIHVGLRPLAPVLRRADRARGHQTALDSRHPRLCAMYHRNHHLRLETREVTLQQ